MQSKEIAQVVVGLPIDGPFDYSVPQNFQGPIEAGMRVRVLFNRRMRAGYVVGFQSKSSFPKLNPILDILDKSPALSHQALQLTKNLSEYYGCSWGEAIDSYLPSALRKDKRLEVEFPISHGSSANVRIELVFDPSFIKRWPLLLDRIRTTIQNNKSVIILTPDGILIESIVFKLKEFSSQLIIAHGLTDKTELEQWVKLKTGSPVIVVGTRSTVFAPAMCLGLIIVLEEEHAAYKEDQSPHYHVTKAAQLRSQIEHCSLIFASAVPSLELKEEAKKQKWETHLLKSEYINQFQLIDMSNYKEAKTSRLSFPLQSILQQYLGKNGKAIFVMNRKGFSTMTSCNSCGHTLKCPRCNLNLTYMYSKKLLVCRHCNYKTELPKICPHCQGAYLRSVGIGTEKLESEIAQNYPQARLARYDKDSAALPKDFDILIATSAILRIPEQVSADIIAVLNFDNELNGSDFRSGYRAFTFLVSLRAWAKERLIVQTRMPDNYCLKAAKNMDFDMLYKEESDLRKELKLPPYQHMLLVALRGLKELDVFELAKGFYEKLEAGKPHGIEISDPYPDIIPKLRDKYRYTIMLKSKSVEKMVKFIKAQLKDFRRRKKVIITINVDP